MICRGHAYVPQIHQASKVSIIVLTCCVTRYLSAYTCELDFTSSGSSAHLDSAVLLESFNTSPLKACGYVLLPSSDSFCVTVFQCPEFVWYVQQQTAKQRRKEAAAELEQAQAQAVQLALEATKAATQARSKQPADLDVPALQSEDSGSLNARREGRRRARRRSRAGGGGAATSSQAHVAVDSTFSGAVAGKDRRKKGGADKKECTGVRGVGIEMGTLLEHWEPIQMTLPGIRWRGVQPFVGTVSIGQAVGGQPAAQGSTRHWNAFSLNKHPVMVALDAALSQQTV